MVFSKLKALLRKAAARTHDELWGAIGQVCDLFSDDECYNFFRTAGMKPIKRDMLWPATRPT